MQSYANPVNYKNNEYVEEIYNSAIELDRDKLRDAINRGISIDVSHGRCNAIMICACEGKANAVNFLLKNGASKHWAIRGAAIRGDKTEVNNLLEEGAGIEWAIEGFAYGGHFDLMEKYIDSHKIPNANKTDEYKIVKFYRPILLGLALGKHHNELNNFLDKYNQYYQDSYDNVENKIQSNYHKHYLFMPNTSNVPSMRMIQSCGVSMHIDNYSVHKDLITAIYNTVVEAYAIAGDVERVEMNLENSSAEYFAAITGFTSAGNFYQANKFQIINNNKEKTFEKKLILQDMQQLQPKDEERMLEEILDENTLLGKIFLKQRYNTKCDKSKGTLKDAADRLETLAAKRFCNENDEWAYVENDNTSCRIS